MRAGACAVQQTLTSEAASVLKHSLILARRRGHAQITPLHVAATLLTTSTRLTLFKRACLKSQPFHSRALELCFNVALNRLPTTPTPPPPLLHTQQPCLSNALIAALKRAQAHQRRGSIEQQQQQQQPLLGSSTKVELEQLVVSILDDPSVSRVMREAGVSSIDVKKNLDDCLVSSVFQSYNITTCGGGGGGIYSTPNSPPSYNNNNFSPTTSFSKDMKLVMDVLLGKNKRNVVVVGDLLSVTEAFVAELKYKVETGDVPEELKSVHFIRYEVFSRRVEVETNILSGLKCKIDSLVLGGKGVIIYIGDLKWAVDNDDDNEYSDNCSSSSPVDYLVEGIGKLVSCYWNLNVWLIASANYHTYMRCQKMQPNLDNQWSLQAVHLPSNGLGLSLNAAARFESMNKNSANTEKELADMFNTCCGECALNYEKELSQKNNFEKKVSNELPYWLKPPQSNLSQKDESVVDLKRKWSKLCQTLHQGNRDNQNQMIPSFNNQGYFGNNSNPCWPTYTGIPDAKSISYAGTSFNPNRNTHSVPRFRRQQSCHIEFNFSNATSKTKKDVPNLDSLKGSEDKEENITLALGSSLIPCSRMQNATDMCKMLHECVPWQSEIIPGIVHVLLDSRSAKKDTWLLINGNDNVGKIRLAFGIAETILGSADLILEFRARNRGSNGSCWVEMLENALKHRDKVVVFVEDIDLADPEFLKFLSDVCQFGTSNATEMKHCQAIFVLTRCESDDSGSRALSAGNKRKAEWDFSSNGKSPRQEGMEEDARQLSSNALDLNIKTYEEQHNPLGFLELIKNNFVFNRDFTKDNQM